MDSRLRELLSLKTVAIDLDGTLADVASACDLGEPGPPLQGAKYACEKFIEQGWQVIIYTCRPSAAACAWLEKHGIPYHAVNVNPHEIKVFKGMSSPKPYARLYIDDSAFPFCGVFPGWAYVLNALERMGILKGELNPKPLPLVKTQTNE